MGYQVDSVEKVNLGEIVEGNSIQFTGSVNSSAVTLSVDVFKITEENIFGIGLAINQDDAGNPTVNEDLSERYFRLPRDGVIEPGNLAIDSLAAPQGVADEVEEFPEESWSPLQIGCVALELFHLVED